MVLNNVRLIGREGVFNIGINEGLISFVSNTPFAEFDDDLQIDLENALAFPGLINSHDHLDFNLFPQLGNGTYANYVQWGDDIHRIYKEEIARVLAIPKALRTKWGIYKNLICGVTTVVDHGDKANVEYPLINVYNQCQNLHSIRLEKNWKSRLNNPLKMDVEAVIHIGEGTDKASGYEIDELLRWNILQRELIGIHGVAMTGQQAQHFKALVWCPETNYFLLNRTAAINELKANTTILFGTDSTLTANWDIWHHIRLARETGLLSDEELYNTLTVNAADTWKLNKGSIAEGKDADIVLVRPGVSSFFEVKPQDILLVIHKGCILLYDELLHPQLARSDQQNFDKIEVNGSHKYVIGNLNALIDEIRLYYPEVNIPINTHEPLTI